MSIALHDARVIVRVDAGKRRVPQCAFGFDRLEAENAIQAFVVGGDAGLQIDVPGAHACRAERVSESMPGKEDV